MFKFFPLILLIIATGCTSFPIPSGSKNISIGTTKPYEKILSRKYSGYALKCDYRSSTRKMQISLQEVSNITVDKISEKSSINEYYYTLIGFYPQYTSAFWGKPSPLSNRVWWGIKQAVNDAGRNLILLFYPWISIQSAEINRKWEPYDPEWKPYYPRKGVYIDRAPGDYAVFLGWAKTSRIIRTSTKTNNKITRRSLSPIGRNFTIEITNLTSKEKRTFHAKNGNIYIPRTMLPGGIYSYPRKFLINCKKYNTRIRHNIIKKKQ